MCHGACVLRILWAQGKATEAGAPRRGPHDVQDLSDVAEEHSLLRDWLYVEYPH